METFPFFAMVTDSVSKKFGIEKVSDSVSEKKWYQKKYWKKLVSKKVLESVSKILGIRKKNSDLVSFRFWVLSHTGGKVKNT